MRAADLGVGLALLADLGGWLLARSKRVGRFVVWQWRAKKSHSSVRSFDVALGATLGSRVIIERGVFIDAASRVDDYSYINPSSSVENATIGKFCSIARDVMIGPASHDYRKLSTHPFWHQPFYGFDCSGVRNAIGGAMTNIGNDVWIACNVVVMQGVTIGDGAVIGAGAIVTKAVGPYEIWAGVPAKKIGQRFSAETIAALTASDWYNLGQQQIAASVMPNIADVEAVLAALALEREATGARNIPIL